MQEYDLVNGGEKAREAQWSWLCGFGKEKNGIAFLWKRLLSAVRSHCCGRHEEDDDGERRKGHQVLTTSSESNPTSTTRIKTGRRGTSYEMRDRD
jgi:hypothetical protein